MPSTTHPPQPGETDRTTDFWTLLLADPDVLHAEFDAIVAAEWPDRPAVPPRRGIPGIPHPGGCGPDQGPTGRPASAGRRVPADEWPRQRSPPQSVVG